MKDKHTPVNIMSNCECCGRNVVSGLDGVGKTIICIKCRDIITKAGFTNGNIEHLEAVNKQLRKALSGLLPPLGGWNGFEKKHAEALYDARAALEAAKELEEE